MLEQFVRFCRPAAVGVDARERWRVALGTAWALGILAWVKWVADLDLAQLNLVLLAPLGATALLIFAVPSSPMAQPWPVILGNTLSAVWAWGVLLSVNWQPLAVLVAVLGAVVLMFVCRCLHPPGAAMAVLVVLSGATHHATGLFISAMGGSVLLVVLGAVINRWTGRAYPVAEMAASATLSAQAASQSPDSSGLVPSPRFSARDLDDVLADYNQVIDVSRSQLEELLARAQTRSYERQLGALRCRDVMTPNPQVVSYLQTIAQAWALMQTHRIKALPVVDKNLQVVGIVSLPDVVGHVPTNAMPVTDDRSEVTVGQIMTRRVRVASEDAMLVDLVPLFSQYGHHHLPVLDGQNRLVGILTQSDMVRALFRAAAPEGVQSP